jgi:hypothetical protein
MGWQLSGSLAIDGADLRILSQTILPQERTVERETPMMTRFCHYIEKVFDFSKQIHSLRDARKRPRIPTLAIWGSVLFLFVMRHRSLHAMEQESRQPKRVERLIGEIKPSADRMGDVLGLMEPDQLREMLSRINHQLGRNKALRNDWPLRVGVFDGHEFFSQSISLLSPMLSTDGEGG